VEEPDLAWIISGARGKKRGGGKPKGSKNPPRVRGQRASDIVIEDRR
jgi:hypothetical protein